ncbi:MAG TPA: alpha/beta fold hydrolase [Actinomycetota bacterium]|nr:alpha/beta fold hydrolase [Actinomycetota bacterium]
MPGPPAEDFLSVASAVPCAISADGTAVLALVSDGEGGRLVWISRASGVSTDGPPFEDVVRAVRLGPNDDLLVERATADGLQLVLWRDGSGDTVVDASDRYHGGAVPDPDGTAVAYARTGSRHNLEVWVVDLATRDRRCLVSADGRWVPLSFSPDGVLLAVGRLTGRASENELALLDLRTAGSWDVSQPGSRSWWGAPEWLPDSSGFYVSTDHDVEFRGIAHYDITTRSWRFELSVDWDLRCHASPDGRMLIVSSNREGETRLEAYPTATMRAARTLDLPAGSTSRAGLFTQDATAYIHPVASDTDPGSIWEHDLATGEGRIIFSPLADHPTCLGAETHRFRTFDGLWVPVVLYRPEGGTDRCPVVVLLHQAPEGQWLRTYNPLAQFLVSRGFAVAAPNLRGSTGYGKRYHSLDDNRKRLQPIGDLAHLVVWLRDQDGVDASRVSLFGTSYGGHQALTALANYPKLFSAAVVISPILDLSRFVAAAPPERRGWLEREFGRLDIYGEVLARLAPAATAETILGRVLVAHAEDDPVVPIGEIESFVGRMDGARLMRFQEGGHGLGDAVARAAVMESAVEVFAGGSAEGARWPVTAASST